MAVITYDANVDLQKNSLIAALLDPVAADPGTPVAGQVWYNTTDARLKFYDGATVQSVAKLTDVTGGAITGNLWDAQTVLVSVLDNDPQPVTIAASSFIGRRSTGNAGNILFSDFIADEGLATTAYADTAEADAVATANGYTDAQIAAILGTASGLYDTLGEIQAFIESNDTEIANLVANKADVYSANFGDAAATSFAIAHNLGSSNPIVAVYRNSDDKKIECDVTVTNANTVTIATNSTPAAAAYRVVVHA